MLYQDSGGQHRWLISRTQQLSGSKAFCSYDVDSRDLAFYTTIAVRNAYHRFVRQQC